MLRCRITHSLSLAPSFPLSVSSSPPYPGHTQVPWLTIDGEPVSRNDDEFTQMFLVGTKVCDAYKVAPDSVFHRVLGVLGACVPARVRLQ